jgi:uncharacterized membrane protein YphA (DoxX/SURF4 family)
MCEEPGRRIVGAQTDTLLPGGLRMSRERIVRVARVVAPWVPALLLITIFVPQGWAKFSDTSGWAVAFRQWGYPTWFRLLIGTIELGASLCLLWGRTAAVGALLIAGVMLGGMGTHVVRDHGRHLTSEVVPLTLAVLVLVTRRRQLPRPRSRSRPRGTRRAASAPAPELR